MVEGGAIDHAAHSNSMEQLIGEDLEFDKAVKVAIDFAAKDGQTLVIVTADHETGGLIKDENGYNFTTGWHTDANVPVFAFGVGASNFARDMVNTDISKIIKQIYEVQGTDSASESPDNSDIGDLSTTNSTLSEATLADGTSEIDGRNDESGSPATILLISVLIGAVALGGGFAVYKLVIRKK